jgi:hypothetical protein
MAIRLVKAAYRYLMASGVPANLVSAGLLGTDPLYATGWVFSGDLTGDPFRAVEGTGKCAVVLYSFDHWAPSTQLHTARYPRLNVAIYADVSRDAQGNYTGHDAEDKAEAIYEQINPLFHDAANRVHAFDDLLVVSTLMGNPLSLMDIPDGDGAVRGLVAYDLTLT